MVEMEMDCLSSVSIYLISSFLNETKHCRRLASRVSRLLTWLHGDETSILSGTRLDKLPESMLGEAT